MSTLFIDFYSSPKKDSPHIPLQKVVIGNIISFHLLQENKIDVLNLITDYRLILSASSIILVIEDIVKGHIIAQKLKEKWPEKTFTPLSSMSVLTLFEDAMSPPPTPTPMKRTFSMILPNLYISNMYYAQNLDLLSSLCISAIINIAPNLAENKFEKHYPFVYLTIYEEDKSSTNLKQYFHMTNRFIDKYIKERGVLVHCYAGISRSSTIIIAYVMYKLNLSMQEAFNYVAERHPITEPNFSFMCQLQEFEKEVKMQ